MTDSSFLANPRVAGNLFVVSAPSGTGKTTIANILQRQNIVRVSISYTTRAPRANEENGKQYFFISDEEFIRRRDAGEFLEWAKVFGHFYGTSRHWLDQQLATPTRILLELDVQGALQVKKQIPAATLIFIQPPSLADLEQRLRARGSDAEQSIALRLSLAQDEMQHASKYDYVIVNDDLQKAITDTAKIIVGGGENCAEIIKNEN